MTDQEAAKAIQELLTRYQENRKKWVEEFGSDKGFDDWFTKQVKGK